jgi:hypothetical protein
MSKSNIGKTIYVAEALPATNNEAGFDALTWVKVNGLVSVGSLGVSHSNIDVPDLQTGFTTGVKGAGTGNDVSIVFRTVASDAGQEDVRNLANAGGAAAVGSIKIVRGTGASQAPAVGDAVQYAQGYFHTYTENEASDTSYEGFTVQFKQNAATVDALEDA